MSEDKKRSSLDDAIAEIRAIREMDEETGFDIKDPDTYHLMFGPVSEEEKKLARLREVEQLARAENAIDPWAEDEEWYQVHCLFCGAVCLPDKKKHAFDCPWAQLRAALGKGE